MRESHLAASTATVAPPARQAGTIGIALGALYRVLRRDLFLTILVPFALLAALWHLGYYPRSWFDEGMYLQVARNFAQGGLYAVRSADGTIDYAPIIGVGPTVLMPAALMIRLFGAGLAEARTVVALLLVGATLTLYLIARRLFDRATARWMIIFLCALPALDWLATGRQLLGEVPAVTLLLAGGVVAWRSAPDRIPVLGGVLLGLVLLTKGQYLLVLPPALCATALFDRIVTRERPLRWYIGLIGAMGATYLAWLALLLTRLNEGQITENIRQLRASSGGALLIVSPERMIAGARLLLGPRSFFLVVPATLFGLWCVRRATGSRRLALAAIWIFQSCWLFWFAFGSIAWPRYAFPGLVVNTLFMGALLATCGGLARTAWQRRRSSLAGFAAVGVLGASVLLVAHGLWGVLTPVTVADQREPQEFAALVLTVVPPGAVVDAWEPELGFFLDRPIQYPPLGSLDRVVRARWLTPVGKQATAVDLSANLRGDYLVVGPFARWVGVYDTALASTAYQPVAQIGEYTLYRRGK